MSNCTEIPKELHGDNNARVSLTDHNGIVSKTRKANPLGFMTKKPLPECSTVLEELGISKNETIPKNR